MTLLLCHMSPSFAMACPIFGIEILNIERSCIWNIDVKTRTGLYASPGIPSIYLPISNGTRNVLLIKISTKNHLLVLITTLVSLFATRWEYWETREIEKPEFNNTLDIQSGRCIG